MEHIEELFELSESDKVCDKCNGIAEVMEGTFEESEVIDEVQRTFRVIKAKRQKAVHQCVPKGHSKLFGKENRRC